MASPLVFHAKVDAIGDVTVLVTNLTDFVQASKDADMFVYVDGSNDDVTTVKKGDLHNLIIEAF